MNQPTVFLLSCGDELLFGHTVDTNAAWMAEQCTILGWRIVGQRTIGDVTPDIEDAFREAAAKADVVLLSGGLGPTADDRTRFALAQAMGVDLYEDPEAVKEIEVMFKRYHRVMAEDNKVQALIPVGGKRIVNPVGTAPGIEATLAGARVFVMPGVPKEMRAMFEQTVAPYLKSVEGRAVEVMRRLHLCGRGESDIGSAIRHLMGERANPEVGTAVADAIVTVRLYAKGDTLPEAEKAAQDAEKAIREVLGDSIFGADGASLAETVVAMLKERGASVITAESCTGGMVAAMLVDVPGVSDVYKEGVVAYANEAKVNRLGVPAELIAKHGAVSREVVAAMAENPLRQRRYPGLVYSLATTGVAGPDGGTPEKPVGTVWLACSWLDAAGNGHTRTLLFNTVADRYGIRLRAANTVLDLLRRTMAGLPPSYEVGDYDWQAE